MMRKCHLNTCPVGIATQDPQLRRQFEGKPEHVVNYFFFVAEEVRELMAQLGVRHLNELIGRTELLDMRKGVEHWKAKGLDFSRIFAMPSVPAEVARFHCETQDHGLEKALDNRLIELAQPALERGEKVLIETPIRNINRTVGTMLSHQIAKRYGHEGLPDDTIHIRFAGSAGQSFGAFLARGVVLDLVGDTNDYCGKGLSGGRICVQPSPKFRGEPGENIITGNVVLYGAIAGEAYFRGVAGERFAVRNSGARAVVEGVGDHGCEYMTGGTVVVLGTTGRNFAAGMSGGFAYVLNVDGEFARRCNTSMVDLEALLPESEDEATVKRLIENHARYTNSKKALHLLEKWSEYRARFVKVFPKEYRRALAEIRPRRGAARADRGPQEALPRVLSAPLRRGGGSAGRALHGLRCAVLHVGMPGQQHHPGLERPGLPAGLEDGDRGPAFDQQLSGIHRPHLPGALRRGVRAAHQRRPGGHQGDRARHRRQGLGRGLGAGAARGAQDGKEGRGRRLRPGRTGLRAATGARRPRRDSVREERPHRRAAALRYSRLQARKRRDRPASGADARRKSQVPRRRFRRRTPARSGRRQRRARKHFSRSVKNRLRRDRACRRRRAAA